MPCDTTLLQEADISAQRFIIDHRTYPTKSLVDPALAESQGPSFIAVNDTVFSDSDWQALQNIHGSNKVDDET